MVSVTLIEARNITDKRHGYRGRVSLIDRWEWFRKGTDKLAPDLGWLALPDGFGRPKARFRSPSFLKTPGEQDPAGTVNGLKSDTAPSPKSANKRKRACTPPDNFLSEDLAFTRKGQNEHGFSCWQALRSPLDAVLAQAADQ